MAARRKSEDKKQNAKKALAWREQSIDKARVVPKKSQEDEKRKEKQ